MEKFKGFILEDDQERIDWFFKNLNFISFDLATDNNEKERKNFSLKTKYDIIFLDHDLGGLIYTDVSKENTGTAFVKWMIKNYVYLETPIIIHSHNSFGANVMSDILTDKGFLVQKIPFGKLVTCWNNGSFFICYRNKTGVNILK